MTRADNIEIADKPWLYKERARLEMRNDDP